jgi:hypothetical protein
VSEGEQFSESSDAGNLIVDKCSSSSRKTCPGRSGGGAPLAEEGVRLHTILSSFLKGILNGGVHLPSPS